MIAIDIKRPEHCRECPAMDKDTKECNLTGKLTPEDGRPEWCRIIEEDEMPTIEPEEMPKFLNDVAYEYFKNDPKIAHKLAQCSVYIHGVLFAEKMRKEKNGKDISMASI